MTVSLSMLAGAGAQFFDDNGDPLSGGLLYTYLAGTTSDATTFMTSTGHAGGDNANPIVLDAAGRVPYQIWLTDEVSYKFVVKTSGGVTVRTYDNIYGAQNGNVLGLLTASSGASLLGFIQAGAGTVASTVQTELRKTVDIRQFGAKGNGIDDDTPAFIAALLLHDAVFVPAGTYVISGNINIQGKALIGVHHNVSKIQLSGTNTNTPMFVNTGNFATSWGAGGGTTLEKLEIIGNWDGSTANAVGIGDFANLGSILRWHAGAKVYVRNCKIRNAFGHALAFDRLGYSYIQNNEITTCKYDGIHLNGPSGVESVTSTWITSNDIHSCRGTSLIYLKNGLTCIAAFNILEDATHGFYVDGNDNRGVSFVFNDMEQASGAAVNIQGAGISFCVTNNFLGVTTPIIIANSPEFRGGVFTNNAFSSVDYVTFMPKIGSGSTYDTPLNFYGAANNGQGTGIIGWISNNNAGASAEVQIVGGHYGTVNQRGGFLMVRTTDPSTGTLTDRIKIDHLGHFHAMVDNTQDLGTAPLRWRTVYAGTGTINTSDENEKQDIRALNDAERRVAINLKSSMRAYRFKDSVLRKGDGARIHFGAIAQKVADAFFVEGLNPNDYGVFCSDTWYKTPSGEILSEPKDTEGNPVENAIAFTRLGLRYDELFAFIISVI